MANNAGSAEVQELERQWEEWLAHEPDDIGPEQQYRWHRRGLKLLRELLALKPTDAELRTNLALTLRWLGEDEKVRMDNLSHARTLLEEALTLRPNDPLIHYHLGWLASKRTDRDVATTHFRRALEGLDLEFSLRIRALCNLVKLLSSQGNIDGAKVYVLEAKRLVSERKSHGLEVPPDCVTMVELAEMDLGVVTSSGVYPYSLQRSNGSSRLLTHEDAMELQGEETAEILTLLILQTGRELKGPVGLWRPPSAGYALGMLCERLMTARGPLKGNVLLEEIWGSGAKSTVTTNIGRLRDHLSSCLGPEGRNAIISNQYGYHWNREIPWQILRDVSEPY